MFAAVQNNGFMPSHFPVDVKQILQDRKEVSGYIGHKKMNYDELVNAQEASHDLTNSVIDKLKSNLNYFMQFRYIAISVTRWSVDHCNALIDLLKNYSGKIILGGYEITAISDDLLLKEFPKADYFIKGYAEKALVKLLNGEIEQGKKILIEKIASEDLISPYLTGVLGLYSRKIYWETKRGCNFSCGFCEWGALKEKTLVYIEEDRLKREIDLIGKSNVEELNILDGTFNFGREYIDILEYILKTTHLKITFQARFEMLIGNLADAFLKLSAQYKERIHMEFGLQTIHEDEMKTIGRDNKMDKIQIALQKLNKYDIDYETSIIYAIPGQTVEKMIDTIEFLLTNNCKRICAHSLQIARNSILEQQKTQLQIIEDVDIMKVRTVRSSYSFSYENKEDMDMLAKRLESDELYSIKEIQSNLKLNQVSEYQYEIDSFENLEDKDYLIYLIDKYYDIPTGNSIHNIDYFQGMEHLGGKFGKPTITRTQYINERNSGSFFYEVKKREPVNFEFNGNNINMPTSNRNIKFYCKIRLGKSGNYYVFREVVYED